MQNWGEQFQIFCGLLRLSESLEHDQQIVLDSARICPIGFKEAPERFDAVMCANQVDDAKLFHTVPLRIDVASSAIQITKLHKDEFNSFYK